MKRIVKLSCLVVLLAVGAGCATQKGWVYSASTYPNQSQVSAKTAVVMPFTDTRSPNNKNLVPVYLVPILPAFGWCNYSTPETAPAHITTGAWANYRPVDDYAKALAQELEAANLFKEAFYDTKKGESDFVIQGKILDTTYKGTIISYGLSVYGPMLWIFGLPAGTCSNELALQIDCVERATNKTVFSKTYTADKYKKTFWIYNLANDFEYAALLKSVYKQAVEDIRKAVQPGQ